MLQYHLLFLSKYLLAQTTINTNGDGEIQVAEAAAFMYESSEGEYVPWDGTSKYGYEVVEDVYYYVITSNKKEQYRGSLTIVK